MNRKHNHRTAADLPFIALGVLLVIVAAANLTAACVRESRAAAAAEVYATGLEAR